MTDSASIDPILKRVYSAEEVTNIQNKETDTWKYVGKSSKKLGGQGFYQSVNVQGNERGQGFDNELSALRQPDAQRAVQSNIQAKIFRHTIRLSGLSLDLAKTDEEAFMDTLLFETDNGMKDSAKELNAALYRDGSGKLAQVNGAVVASTSVIFDNGVPTHFRNGMYIDVMNGATKEVDSRKIVDVDMATNTLTLDAAVNASNNAYIYREDGADNAPADGKDIAGLPLYTDDGTISATFQGVNRTTYPGFKGIVLDAGSANLSDDLLQRAASRVKIFSGRKVKRVCSNTSQFRKYLSVVTPAKEFAAKDKMDSGYEVMPTWNGLEWIIDTDCGFGDVYMYDPALFERFEARPLGLDDTDGKILKWDSGFDAFVVYAKFYGNTGGFVPNSAVRIKNLAVPAF